MMPFAFDSVAEMRAGGPPSGLSEVSICESSCQPALVPGDVAVGSWSWPGEAVDALW